MGKTAIYQSIKKIFQSVPADDPNLIKVILCAPTGKPGFGLHSAFLLSVNQSDKQICPFGSESHSKFWELKLLIIDELSIVGAKMFNHLDTRLKQILKSNNLFGGIGIIAMGILNNYSRLVTGGFLAKLYPIRMAL